MPSKDNPLRFHNPGRHMGKKGKCEKCGGKMKGHMWIEVDPNGKITRCSVSEGLQSKL